MLITRSSEYAIELIIWLVNQDDENFAPLNQIAEKTGLSFHFLGKISQILVKNGILKTYRGPNGGVALARPASEISLYDIVSSIEGDSFLTECLVRPTNCLKTKGKLCPMHTAWSTVQTDIHDVFFNFKMDAFIESK